MNEALHRPPLLGRVLEDEYGRSCGFLWLIEGPIVSKLELEPPMSGSSPLYLPLRKPCFVCRNEERCGFSFLMGGLIVSTTPRFGSSY
jgi:hypothetical protein